jgi:hypothetical protein
MQLRLFSCIDRRFKMNINISTEKKSAQIKWKLNPLKTTTCFRNNGRSEPYILGEVLPPTIHQKVVNKH